MKIKLYLPLMLILSTALLFTIGCEDDSDDPAPEISFTQLKDNCITDDPGIIEVNASSNNGISSVTLVVNDGNARTMTYDGNYWTFSLDWGDAEIGESVEIKATARDNDGQTSSTETITIFNRYVLLESDAVENHPRNLVKIYSRADHQYLGFMVVFSEEWGDPYDVTEGIDCSIFIDSDRNSDTGLSEDTDYFYTPNEIGADYLILCGFEGNGLFTWDAANSEWDFKANLRRKVTENSTSLEVAVELDSLSSPQHLDLVAGSITVANGTSYLDWLPDDEALSLPVVDLYTGLDYLDMYTSAQSLQSFTPYFWIR